MRKLENPLFKKTHLESCLSLYRSGGLFAYKPEFIKKIEGILAALPKDSPDYCLSISELFHLTQVISEAELQEGGIAENARAVFDAIKEKIEALYHAVAKLRIIHPHAEIGLVDPSRYEGSYVAGNERFRLDFERLFKDDFSSVYATLEPTMSTEDEVAFRLIRGTISEKIAKINFNPLITTRATTHGKKATLLKDRMISFPYPNPIYLLIDLMELNIQLSNPSYTSYTIEEHIRNLKPAVEDLKHQLATAVMDLSWLSEGDDKIAKLDAIVERIAGLHERHYGFSNPLRNRLITLLLEKFKSTLQSDTYRLTPETADYTKLDAQLCLLKKNAVTYNEEVEINRLERILPEKKELKLRHDVEQKAKQLDKKITDDLTMALKAADLVLEKIASGLMQQELICQDLSKDLETFRQKNSVLLPRRAEVEALRASIDLEKEAIEKDIKDTGPSFRSKQREHALAQELSRLTKLKEPQPYSDFERDLLLKESTIKTKRAALEVENSAAEPLYKARKCAKTLLDYVQTGRRTEYDYSILGYANCSYRYPNPLSESLKSETLKWAARLRTPETESLVTKEGISYQPLTATAPPAAAPPAPAAAGVAVAARAGAGGDAPAHYPELRRAQGLSAVSIPAASATKADHTPVVCEKASYATLPAPAPTFRVVGTIPLSAAAGADVSSMHQSPAADRIAPTLTQASQAVVASVAQSARPRSPRAAAPAFFGAANVSVTTQAVEEDPMLLAPDAPRGAIVVEAPNCRRVAS